MFKFLGAPKRLLAKGLKRRSLKTINLQLLYIDTESKPSGGHKAIADKETEEYSGIYIDPYLQK